MACRADPASKGSELNVWHNLKNIYWYIFYRYGDPASPPYCPWLWDLDSLLGYITLAPRNNVFVFCGTQWCHWCLYRQALLLIAIVDFAARKVAKPKQRHLLNV